MCRGVGPGVTVEKRCLATALRAAQYGGPGDMQGGRCSGSHLEKFPASLAGVGVGWGRCLSPRESFHAAQSPRWGGREWGLSPSLHGHSSREGLFLEGVGNLFFACADWLTGACIIPYKCKYFPLILLLPFSSSLTLSIPQSLLFPSPSFPLKIKPFTFHFSPIFTFWVLIF